MLSLKMVVMVVYHVIVWCVSCKAEGMCQMVHRSLRIKEGGSLFFKMIALWGILCLWHMLPDVGSNILTVLNDMICIFVHKLEYSS